MEPVKLGEPELEKRLQEKRQAVKNLVNLVRVTRRMAVKIYLYNSRDEIFTDGTFTDDSLKVIKKGAQIVARALAMARADELEKYDIEARADYELNKGADNVSP